MRDMGFNPEAVTNYLYRKGFQIKPSDHIMSEEDQANIAGEKDEKGRKVPLAYDTRLKRSTRITNLHIHSKEIEKYISF